MQWGSPLPIPNREVKPISADGTAPPGGRVGRRLLRALHSNVQGFFYRENIRFGRMKRYLIIIIQIVPFMTKSITFYIFNLMVFAKAFAFGRYLQLVRFP